MPWPWGVLSGIGRMGISSGELLGWGGIVWNGILSSRESVSLRGEVLWSGGHPGAGASSHVAMQLGY